MNWLELSLPQRLRIIELLGRMIRHQIQQLSREEGHEKHSTNPQFDGSSKSGEN